MNTENNEEKLDDFTPEVEETTSEIKSEEKVSEIKEKPVVKKNAPKSRKRTNKKTKASEKKVEEQKKQSRPSGFKPTEVKIMQGRPRSTMNNAKIKKLSPKVTNREKKFDFN